MIGRTISGLESLEQSACAQLHNQRIGVFCNHTAVNSSGIHLIDLLAIHAPDSVKVAFSPEHGFTGNAGHGETVPDSKRGNIPIVSLYGKRSKPTTEELRGLDLLLFDIQDVGVRCYTYLHTLTCAVETSAEHGIPLIVLDRPNPLGGIQVEGPRAEREHLSIVAPLEIPFRHGMTFGELAQFTNDSPTIEKYAQQAEITVIKMEGWERSTHFSNTGWSWVPPSPNLRTYEAARIYPATVFLEATAVSEGRGTEAPFLTIGAPWIDSTSLQYFLNSFAPELQSEPFNFTPQSSNPPAPKYAEQLCNGVRINPHSTLQLSCFKLGISLLAFLVQKHPHEVNLNHEWLTKLTGSEETAKAINTGQLDQFFSACDEACLEFQRETLRYLLY